MLLWSKILWVRSLDRTQQEVLVCSYNVWALSWEAWTARKWLQCLAVVIISKLLCTNGWYLGEDVSKAGLHLSWDCWQQNITSQCGLEFLQQKVTLQKMLGWNKLLQPSLENIICHTSDIIGWKMLSSYLLFGCLDID